MIAKPKVFIVVASAHHETVNGADVAQWRPSHS